jgi:LysM repeat protein
MATHTVKSGENLLKIAKIHKITLAKLLDANPRFKDDPNTVRAGDILNIPDGADASTPEPPPGVPPTPLQPQPSADTVLGKLSEQFETGGRGPGTVSTGVGDSGGVSYGSYQLTSEPNGGNVKTFVMRADFPFRDQFVGLTPGKPEFTKAWKDLAKSNGEEFQRVQHDYIKETHFDPLVSKILEEDGLNVLTRSAALQDVVWSTAVQHGPANRIAHRALAKVNAEPDDADFDRKIIVAIYDERGRTKADGTLFYFQKNKPNVQQGVANRFKKEVKLALAMLDGEG